MGYARSAFRQCELSTSECYSISAKDSTIGSHHALREVKRTPRRAKTSNLLLTGRLKVELRACKWEAGHTHVQKRVGMQKGRGKVKSILDFLLSKLPKPHPLSLATKNSRKSTRRCFLLAQTRRRDIGS